MDLERVVVRAAEELRPQAEEAGISLRHERVGTQFVVVGDEERLVQVVVNLVANAVRFTPTGGHVVLRNVDAGPECEVQVEDTGIGIPAAELPHVFETYRQAHAGRGGTGLGLAIVRALVLAHGGRVTVESHEGKGSRFSVLLPREVRPRASPSAVSRAPAVLLLMATTAGCASWPVTGGGPALLSRADHQAREGAWEDAVATYDEYLARFPDAAAAPRALESRDSLAAMLDRAGASWRGCAPEVMQLRAEVMQLRAELAQARQI